MRRRQWLIIQCVVLAAVVAGGCTAVYQFGLLGVLALPAMGVAALALLVHPLFAFSMYAFVLLFKSSTFADLPVSPNQLLAPLFFLSTLVWYLRGRALRVRSPLLPLLAIVALYFTTNAVLGLDAERGLLHARYVVIYFIFALCVASNLKTERSILALAWIIVGLLLVAASAAFYQNMQSGIISGFTGHFGSKVRLKGWAPNSIVFAWQMVFGVPFAFFLYSQSATHFARVLALVAATILIAAAGMTFNRQTYVLIGVVVLLCGGMFAYRNRRLLLGFAASLGVLATVTILPLLVLRFASVGNLSRDVSYLERRDSVLIGAEMIRQYPVGGVGLGSFPAVWKDFLPADYATFFAQYRLQSFEKFPDLGYLAITAETGFAGLSFLILLYAAFAYKAFKHWQLGRRVADPLIQNLSAMVFVLIVYVAATTAIQDTFLYAWTWVLYGIALLVNKRMLPPKVGDNNLSAGEHSPG